MANDTSTGYSSVFNAPARPGQFLFTMDPVSYPFMSNLNGPLKLTNTSKYGMGSEYDLETFAQPAITEAASLTAPTAITYTRALEENVTQIYQRKVNVTYRKQSDSGRLTLASTDTRWPNSNPQADELAFQMQASMEQIYGDMEYTFLNGAYQAATSSAQADKTRGILSAISTNAVAAGSAALSKALVDNLLLTMAGNGAQFRRPVIMTTAYNKIGLSEIYGVAARDRNVGGLNITELVTDFGIINVVWSRFIPAGALLLADMEYCYMVNQPTPGKNTIDGILYQEELSKTGMSESYQLWAQTGIDYGSEKFHGKITGLATS